jgi:4-hydroxyproline epimerase
MLRIRVVDSHTGGEPTRVVVEGGPGLGAGPLAERRERFRTVFDHYRSAIVGEPRAGEATVGALLCEPVDPSCRAGVIFFDNSGYLGMCGHGTIGLVVTLAHLGAITPGRHAIETPVGVVTAELQAEQRVTVTNVPSYRFAANVSVDVPGHGRVTGDVAWGGNWFFLVSDHGRALSFEQADALTDYAAGIRRALQAAGVCGALGAEVDHIELFGPSARPEADSRSFVLCPGNAYDRSPCGTGTSAKLACLHAEGKLRPGEIWRQESITGSVFEGRFTVDPGDAGRIVPEITGTAYITGEAVLLVDERDPVGWGLRDGR